MSNNNMSHNDKNHSQENPSESPLGYVINDKGEEIPITEAMVTESITAAKPHSIGKHTGVSPAITDTMLADAKQNQD